jgi:hypothetical protein
MARATPNAKESLNAFTSAPSALEKSPMHAPLRATLTNVKSSEAQRATLRLPLISPDLHRGGLLRWINAKIIRRSQTSTTYGA